jgi:phosphonate transport system permease protein
MMKSWAPFNHKRRLTLKSGTVIVKPFPISVLYIGAVVLLTLIFSVFITFNPQTINLNELGSIITRLFTPKPGRTWDMYFAFMFTLDKPLLDTIQMSFAGTMIGSIAAIPFAIFMASNIVKSRWIYQPVRFFTNLFRTIPQLLLALIAVFFVGLGILAGIIAITLFSFGIMAKMLYELIEVVDLAPYEAIEATGANKTKAFAYGVVPQILPLYVSYLIYIFEINIRASAILGYVGAGGIGMVIRDNILYNYDRVGATIIVLLVFIVLVQFISTWLRGKLQ